MNRLLRKSRSVLTAAWIVCGLLVADGPAASSQGARAGEEEAESLVVMIQAKLAGEDSVGAGIVVGAGADVLYIATANHVVRRGAQEAQGIQVEFWRLGKPARATLTKHFDASLDLAVLSVAGLKQQGIDAGLVPFRRMGDASALQRGEGVYSLGNARSVKWSVNVTLDKVARVERDFVVYESNFIGKGHSGGALLDERRHVVGMILSDEPPNGRAVSIAAVLGRLKGWGLPVNLRAPLAQVVAGYGFTCRVGAGGVAHCWEGVAAGGADGGGGPELWSIRDVRFRSISVGRHVCGVAFDGAAYCVGNNDKGQLGNGSRVTSDETALPVQGGLRFASVSAGISHTCGITTAGRAYCWGDNDSGLLGIDEEGDREVPVRVAGGLTFKSISAGFMHTCGLTTSGAAYCWGVNEVTELGTSTYKGRWSVFKPEPVLGNHTFESLSAGRSHTCAVATDGGAYCWGWNQYGQIGNNFKGVIDRDSTELYTRTDYMVFAPTPVAGGLKFKSVSTGIYHTCGVTTSGAAYCWGQNAVGQLGNGTTKDSNVPVAVAGGLVFESVSTSHFHACGVTTDGSTYCWGGVEENRGAGKKAGSTVPVRVAGLP